jgi:FixJ family two-component response regulator
MAITGPKVVLVDDDASMRQALGHLRDAAGCNWTAYESAEALLDGHEWEAAACVVSDLGLPGMSGFELLDWLRARGASMPVVVITAHDAPGRREDAMRRGAAEYLAKPFRGTVLLGVIRAVMQSAGPQ